MTRMKNQLHLHTMNKPATTRFTASLPQDLLRNLDRIVREKGFASRSQAIAHVIRDTVDLHAQETDDVEAAGTLTLVYDHHHRHLQRLLTRIQHDHHREIISTLHVHLDHDRCLEVILLRGKVAVIRGVADHLISARGVEQGRLTLATLGRSHHR